MEWTAVTHSLAVGGINLVVRREMDEPLSYGGSWYWTCYDVNGELYELYGGRDGEYGIPAHSSRRARSMRACMELAALWAINHQLLPLTAHERAQLSRFLATMEV